MLFKETVNNVDKIFISMPGVPFEMMAMMTDDVIPYLKQKFTTTHIVHRTLLTSGVGESMLADMIIAFEKTFLQSDIIVFFLLFIKKFLVSDLI